jgi:hypothetical protein
VVTARYGTAFATLGGVALVGFLVYLFAMPETRKWPADVRKTAAVAAAPV